MANKDFENKEKKFEKDKNQIFEDDYEISLKKIAWDEISSDIAGKDEVNKIRLVAGGPNDMLAPEGDLTAIFSNSDDAKATAEAFLKVLETRDESRLKYLLTLLSHILEHDPKRGRVFLQAKADNVMQPFIRVWIREDLSAFTRGKAAVCGSYILRWANESLKDAYASLNTFIMNQLKSFKSDGLVLPLYALKGAIANLSFQSAFTQSGGIDRLYLVIRENSEHRQVVYLTVYSLWALSFQEVYVNHEGLLNGALISELVSIVQKRFSSKVCRVILGFFENMLGRENLNEMLIMFNLYPTLEILQEEKSEDPEFQNSVKNLLEKLVVSVRIMTSVERYYKELDSDKLAWGPCHTEAFWKRYAVLFEEDNYKQIKRLIKLLQSPDNETVAVACNDLGEWSRFYPDGKKVIETLKGKQILMQLIGHKDPAVSKHAIVAVQKMLIRNWKALESQKADDSKDQS